MFLLAIQYEKIQKIQVFKNLTVFTVSKRFISSETPVECCEVFILCQNLTISYQIPPFHPRLYTCDIGQKP
jgi:hypothetical protein